jgi:hypothetical protein
MQHHEIKHNFVIAGNVHYGMAMVVINANLLVCVRMQIIN